MGENKEYKPDVYRRLELVQKQFKTSSAEQKKAESAARRQAFFDNLRQNRKRITRVSLYVILGIVLTAVILVVVFDKI